MNHRERWINCLHFQPIDRIPDEEFGYWDETIVAWHDQGLPKTVRNNPEADVFFGFAERRWAPVNFDLAPGFETKVVEEDDRHQIIIDGNGVKCMIFKYGSQLTSIPHFIDHTLKDRASWQEFKKRLDPEVPGRYPSNWSEITKQWENRTYPLGIHVGSLWGRIRDWMGLEGAAICTVEEPDLMEDMVEHLCNLIMRVLENVVVGVQYDFADFWEDMAFNGGPLISPADFERILVPRYKRITDFLKQHGVDIVYVDCDGDINQLAPLWIQAGVRGMFPIERASHSDPYRLRDKFGKDVILLGGVNKIALIAGREEIRKELNHLKPLADQGGYIPHVDHRVPPDVTYENYLYYLDYKRDLFGIPRPTAHNGVN
ncbi:MAG: hypothetical protein M1330_02505 [Armatimonadetes bacterium]|nr:hypothetical protein [Armatimonadota bacterium]